MPSYKCKPTSRALYVSNRGKSKLREMDDIFGTLSDGAAPAWDAQKKAFDYVNGLQYEAPLTGVTITVGPNIGQLVINPAGAIAALTVALPASPSNGDPLTLSFTKAVTSVTLSGGTVVGAITSAAAASFASYVYSSGAAAWVRNG